MRSKADETFFIVETFICPLQISYLNCVMYFRNAILMQKLDQTFIKPFKFLGKFFVKIYI